MRNLAADKFLDGYGHKQLHNLGLGMNGSRFMVEIGGLDRKDIEVIVVIEGRELER